MSKICYDIQTRFLKFTDQKKTAKNVAENETNPF